MAYHLNRRLAKISPPAGYELDGHSLLPVLTQSSSDGHTTAEPVARDFTFSEFFLACSTWRKLRIAKYIDSAGVSRRLSFHAWCTNQTEVYDLDADPYQVRVHDFKLTETRAFDVVCLRVLCCGSGMMCACMAVERSLRLHTNH